MPTVGKTKVTDTDKRRGDRPVAICTARPGFLSLKSTYTAHLVLDYANEAQVAVPIRADVSSGRSVAQGRGSLETTGNGPQRPPPLTIFEVPFPSLFKEGPQHPDSCQ